MSEESKETPLTEMIGKLAEEMKKVEDDYVMLADVQWPVEVRGVKVWVTPPFLDRCKCGDPVRVRLAGESATHVGIFLGHLVLPGDYLIAYHKPKAEFCVPLRTNPAMFVPALRRVVWGAESWWAPVKDAADMERAITDADIEGQPYVQMLRALAEKEA